MHSFDNDDFKRIGLRNYHIPIETSGLTFTINNVEHKTDGDEPYLHFHIHGSISKLIVNNCKSDIIISLENNCNYLEINNSKLFMIWSENGTVGDCTISGSEIGNVMLKNQTGKIAKIGNSKVWNDQYCY